VGTRYGVIYIGSEGNEESRASTGAEAREPDLGMVAESRASPKAEAREPDSGNGT
jgi:hypothetical protein